MFGFPMETPVLDPVAQSMDNAIHRINHYPVDKCWQNKQITTLSWIVIYLAPVVQRVNNAIHPDKSLSSG